MLQLYSVWTHVLSVYTTYKCSSWRTCSYKTASIQIKKKILYEICYQLDAQPDVNSLSDGSSISSSTSSDGKLNSTEEQNIIDVLQLSTFRADEQNEECQDATNYSNDNGFVVFNCKTNLASRTTTLQNWQRTCHDTGAQSTVIGLPQALAHCRFIKI